jgi:hypothetical protein
MILMALLVGTAEAKVNSCEFKLICSHVGNPFSVQFKSPSGDCTEDDMDVTLAREGVAKNLPIKKDWYMFTEHISKTQSSLCKAEGQNSDFAAYAVDDNRVLLFAKSSGRPGYDQVHALLLDVKSGELSDHKRLGTSRNNYVAVLKQKNGFKVRIIRDSLSFHQQVSCDCDAPFVDDWMEISVSKGKIKTSWSN